MRHALPASGVCFDNKMLSPSVPSLRCNSNTHPLNRKTSSQNHLHRRVISPLHSSATCSHGSSDRVQAQSAPSSKDQRTPLTSSTFATSSSTFAASHLSHTSRCPAAQRHSQQHNGLSHASRPQVHLHSSAASSLPVPDENKPKG